MKIKWLASAFVCTTLAYCGGGSGGSSGVDGGKTIGELSDAEVMDLCEYLATLQPVRTITCQTEQGEVTLNLGVEPEELDEEIAECTLEVSALDACPATVSQAESCAEGNAAQIADLSDAEICELLTDETAEPPPPPAACQALDDAACEEPEPA